MKAALKLDVTYDQVLSLVKNLPVREKIKLSKDLEKDGIYSKLSAILKSFKTNDLKQDTINVEVEIVRQKLYERKKH